MGGGKVIRYVIDQLGKGIYPGSDRCLVCEGVIDYAELGSEFEYCQDAAGSGVGGGGSGGVGA